MLDAVNKSNATATDFANWLVKNLNMTFRESYKLTGKIVGYATKNKKQLKDLTLKELQLFNKKISISSIKVFSSLESLKNKTSFGGTSPQSTNKSIKYAIKKYIK